MRDVLPFGEFYRERMHTWVRNERIRTSPSGGAVARWQRRQRQRWPHRLGRQRNGRPIERRLRLRGRATGGTANAGTGGDDNSNKGFDGQEHFSYQMRVVSGASIASTTRPW
jgi:hypothetical protein